MLNAAQACPPRSYRIRLTITLTITWTATFTPDGGTPQTVPDTITTTETTPPFDIVRTITYLTDDAEEAQGH